ncbi:type I restriction-modification enzyme R subunit C-terminal domain-containing protein [Natrononativus amylolyticus]|uniref:type I restriction endonuclease subunit R n=1 Tax=Natrononativus amylolyticus TaxID=2963434 RepID=UPI0020CFE3E1|nr:type I restriction-modification enzyme R subunit C-terminal domain-containing protein [Natrononativus amylolyticus]
MLPEEESRAEIDKMLESAGWEIQDYGDHNLGANNGHVAIREYQIGIDAADYMLFLDRQAVGVIEAKPKGTTLSGVEEQSKRYAESFPERLNPVESPLPFVYESTSVETYFRDLRDVESRSRELFWFHKPEELRELLNREDTLRNQLRRLPKLEQGNLRDAQFEAIQELEKSLAGGRPRSLIQMATGSGKTYMAVEECYRLIKHANAKRILFLVDRKNLGKNADTEFQQFDTPAGRKFTEEYNVQRFQTGHIDPASKVCISTIQRMYSILQGEEVEEEQGERSQFEEEDDDEEQREVEYNPDVPITEFDFIIIDECHRSIYNKWRQVLDYFDAFLIGLTATPAKHTLGFFNQNLVTEYSQARAVADRVNVGYDVYSIRTRATEEGDTLEAGYTVGKRDTLTREEMWEQLDDTMEYRPTQLDRDVVKPDQIRTVMESFRDNLTSMFPGRDQAVPKTLVFAKNDSHADDIVRISREVFGKGNDFCKKITYKSMADPENLISEFRNSYNPRIAVSVDMISTGTDIKPLECLIFLRDVKSRTYFEQMKGRGTRTIDSNDLQQVTPDAEHKTRFVLVDAVGVTETDKTDSEPLDREPSASFEDVLEEVSLNPDPDDDTLSTLAERLSRMDKVLEDEQRRVLEQRGDASLNTMINDLLTATNRDAQLESAREQFDTDDPSDEQIEEARGELVEQAKQHFDDSGFRETLTEIKKQNIQYIDPTADEVIEFEAEPEKSMNAEQTVDRFREFIEDNKDEIAALEIIYNQPHRRKELTYETIRELADTLTAPPYNLRTEEVWEAYEQLESSRVAGKSEKQLLTDIISIIRFEMGESDQLEPFGQTVEERFEAWLADRSDSFSRHQLEWLDMMKDHIATSAAMEKSDLQLEPFNQRGGLYRAHEVFDDVDSVIEELNQELVA